MKPLDACSLYTFVDTSYLRGRDPANVALELCDGGSDIIQLRAKDLTAKDIRPIAAKVLHVTERAGVWLVINDHPEIAIEIGAPLTHLGQEDFFDAAIPVSPGQALGLSSHAPAEAERAVAAGAAYIAIGPVFPTPTKPSAKAVTLDYVRWAANNLQVPWFAIGGINLRNVDAVLEAGATRICVVSDILNSPDIPKACQAFKQRLVSAARK
jgi:thiamine-phosphate pyrophosphorylase